MHSNHWWVFPHCEKQFLLKWQLSKLLGNSLAVQNRAKDVMTMDGFYFRLEDSTEHQLSVEDIMLERMVLNASILGSSTTC